MPETAVSSFKPLTSFKEDTTEPISSFQPLTTFKPEELTVPKAASLLDEVDQLSNKPELKNAFGKIDSLSGAVSSNKPYMDYVALSNQFTQQHPTFEKDMSDLQAKSARADSLLKAGNIEAYNKTVNEYNYKVRTLQEPIGKAKALNQLAKDPNVVTGNQTASQLSAIYDANKPLIEEYNTKSEELRTANADTLTQAHIYRQQTKPFIADKQAAKDVLAKLKDVRFQQQYLQSVESSGGDASKVYEELRDKKDLLQRTIAGEFDKYTPPGPVENVIQGVLKNAKELGYLASPAVGVAISNAVGYDPKQEQIKRIASYANEDPDFKAVFQSIPQRELGAVESIAKGAAEIVPLIPSFRVAGKLVSEVLPTIAYIPKVLKQTVVFKSTVVERGIGKVLETVTERVVHGTTVLVGKRAARAFAANLVTAIPRGAATFGVQSILTGGDGLKAPVQGAAFETANTITSAIEEVLPTKYKTIKFIAPLVRAFMGGTTFAGGAALTSAAMGESQGNLFEEFGKGFTLSLFHSAAERIEKRLSEKDPSKLTPEETTILENARQLRAARGPEDIALIEAKEPVLPKPTQPVQPVVAVPKPIIGKEKAEAGLTEPSGEEKPLTPVVQKMGIEQRAQERVRAEKEAYQREKLLKQTPVSSFRPVINVAKEPSNIQQIRDELLTAGLSDTEIAGLREPELRAKYRQVAGISEEALTTPKAVQPVGQGKAISPEKAIVQVQEQAKQAIEDRGLRFEKFGKLAGQNVAVVTDPISGTSRHISIEGLTAEKLNREIADIRTQDFPDIRPLREAGATQEQINALKSKTEAEDLLAKFGKKGKVKQPIFRSAALTYKGKIYEGMSHAEAAEKAGFKVEDEKIPYKDYGFVTSDGKFVAQHEAEKMIKSAIGKDWEGITAEEAIAEGLQSSSTFPTLEKAVAEAEGKTEAKTKSAAFRIGGQVYEVGAVHDLAQVPKEVRDRAKSENLQIESGFVNDKGEFFIPEKTGERPKIEEKVVPRNERQPQPGDIVESIFEVEGLNQAVPRKGKIVEKKGKLQVDVDGELYDFRPNFSDANRFGLWRVVKPVEKTKLDVGLIRSMTKTLGEVSGQTVLDNYEKRIRNAPSARLAIVIAKEATQIGISERDVTYLANVYNEVWGPKNKKTGYEERDPLARVSDKILDILKSGERIRNTPALNAIAQEVLGKGAASGEFDFKGLYDAAELALNRYILETFPGGKGLSVEILNDLSNRLPTETERTGEQIAFQQFSTPSAFAFVVADVANINDQDIVLEPSGGLGNIAVFGLVKNAARVIVNELSETRSKLLKLLPFHRVEKMNAEHIGLKGNPLENEKPTVIVMNPPFSATAGRTATNDPMVAANHITAAFRELQAGGRLVTIVGRGMDFDNMTYRKWWLEMAKKSIIKANILVSGEAYRKKGTNFDNRILVFDKITPIVPQIRGKETRQVETQTIDTSNIVMGEASNYDELKLMLEGVKDERITLDRTGKGTEQVAAPTGGAALARPGTRTSVTGVSVRPPTNVVGQPEPYGGVGRPAEGGSGTTTGRPHVPAGTGQRPQPLGGPEAGGGKPGVTGAQAGSKPVGGGEVVNKPIGERGGGENRPGAGVTVEQNVKQSFKGKQLTDSVFEDYRVTYEIPGSKVHPANMVESAAMAAVELPPVSYRPNIAKENIAKGRPSSLQLEGVILAGEAHARTLPNGERQGFFIGDGTGSGKGIQVSSIIIDNFNQGRTKAVWFSANDTQLYEAAQKDWQDVGGKPEDLFRLSKVKLGTPLSVDRGIMFVGYGTLRSRFNAFAEKQKQGEEPEATTNESRIEQIAKWFGKDYDGVIVFDEAHKMGNVIPMKGKRGVKRPSQTALAGVMLQKMLPKARIVYSSATGATEVSNLAYGSRLGLWGEGTPFVNVTDFVSEIGASGLSAMELVAKDLKAFGLYEARHLSFRDVTYKTLTHTLLPAQEELYNKIAMVWQGVLQHINEAVDRNNTGKGALAAAMSQFWGTQQRFFNQIILSMQLPTVIEDMRENLKLGNAPVIQLVNTNEAATEREIAKQQGSENDIKIREQEGVFVVERTAEDDDTEAQTLAVFNTREEAEAHKTELAEIDLDALDISPKDMIVEYVRNSFPVHQYEDSQDDNGNPIKVLALAPDGTPLENPESVAARDALIQYLQEEVRVPMGALDLLIQEFGIDQVAEVTGRHRRIIRDSDGNLKLEKRSGSAAQADANAFQDAKKSVLIFSEKGGTGAGYHADLTRKNQRKRIHYIFQPGWRANNAVQGFGRTHRTNQASAPQYVLVTTNLKAQKRFLSSIARRLDQQGALTTGQRKAGSQVLSSEYNLETPQSRSAIISFCFDLVHGDIPNLTYEQFSAETGLNFVDPNTGSIDMTKIPDIPKFLNRLLTLTIPTMDTVFDEFSERLERAVEADRQMGVLDKGIEDLTGLSIREMNRETVYQHPNTNAISELVELQIETQVERTDLGDIEDLSKTRKLLGYTENQEGKVFAVFQGSKKMEADGTLRENVIMVSPLGRRYIDKSKWEHSYNWNNIEKKDFEKSYNAQYDETPTSKTERHHLITGLTLPLWDKIGGKPLIRRVQTDEGRRMIGRLIPQDELMETLENIGAKRLKLDLPARDIIRKIWNGATIKLANGFELSKRSLQGEVRIEIKGATKNQYKMLENKGAYIRVISALMGRSEVFLPTGVRAEQVLDDIIKAFNAPAVSIKGGNDQGEDSDGALYSTIPGLPELVKAGKELTRIMLTGTTELPLDGVRFTDGEIKLLLQKAEKSTSTLFRLASIPYWVGEKYPGFGDIWQQGKIVREGVWGIVDRKMNREYHEAVGSVFYDVLNEWRDAKFLSDNEKKTIGEAIESLNLKHPLVEDLPDARVQKLFGFSEAAIAVYRQIRNALEAGLNARKALDKFKIMRGEAQITGKDLKKYLKGDAIANAGFNEEEVALIKQIVDQPAKKVTQQQIDAIWNLVPLRSIIADGLVEDKYALKTLANYFPLTRMGKFFVVARNPAETSGIELTPEEHLEQMEDLTGYEKERAVPPYLASFDTAKEANEHANMLKRLGFEPVQGEVEIIAYNVEKDFPERLKRSLTEVQLFDVVEAAGVDSDNPTVRALAKELRSRGFDRHFIERQRAPGFQFTWKNIERATTDYYESSMRKYAKYVGARLAEDRLQEIRAEKTLPPEIINYAQEYLENLQATRPAEWTLLRQGIYITTLGASVANFITNLSQPLETTYNEIPLEMEKSGVVDSNLLAPEKIMLLGYQYAARYMIERMGRKVSGVDWPLVPAEWKPYLDKAERQQVTNPLQLEQLAGLVTDPRLKYPIGGPFVRGVKFFWQSLTDVMAIGQRISETINRYQTLFVGLHIGQKYFFLEGDRLYDYAIKFVQRTQFQFGAHNQSQLGQGLRGTKSAGIFRRLTALGLILRGFVLNMFSRVSQVSRVGNVGANVRLWGTLFAISGLRGLPLYGLMLALWNLYLWLTGSEETAEIKERRAYGGVERTLGLPERTLTTGPIGAIAGVETSRLMGIGDFPPSNMTPADALGVATSIIDRSRYAFEAFKKGQIATGLQQTPFVPRGLSAILRGRDAWKEGIIQGGRVLVPPDSISDMDGIKLSLGLTPTKLTQAYEEARAQRSVGKLGQRKYNDFMDMYVKAIVSDENAKASDVIDQIFDFNKGVGLENQIDLKRFMRDAVSRTAGITRNKMQIQKREELKGIYRQ